MGKNNKIVLSLLDTRNQLIWALTFQEYELLEIGKIFNLDRATIYRIQKKMPEGWEPKWVKVQ